MNMKQKAVAYFRKKPEAPASAFAKLYGISNSYAHKLKVYAIDCIAEDYDTRPDVIIERGWTVTTNSDGEMIGSVGKTSTPLDTQVGGDHYKKFKIQPVEFIHANNLPFIEGNIVKYIVRWREKNGLKDLEKVKHYVDLLIELEQLKKNL
jgi:hypothetical protein